jgi:hypothetical protein
MTDVGMNAVDAPALDALDADALYLLGIQCSAGGEAATRFFTRVPCCEAHSALHRFAQHFKGRRE